MAIRCLLSPSFYRGVVLLPPPHLKPPLAILPCPLKVLKNDGTI